MNLLKAINFVFPYYDFIYILQKEEYSSSRLLKWLPKFFFRRNIAKREKLDLTKRSLVILSLSVLISVFAFIIYYFLFEINLILLFLVFLIISLLIPLWVFLANSISTPIFEIFHFLIRLKAKKIIENTKNLRVISIAGSYGKTTTKLFLYELIRFTYKTQVIPDNINTSAGIAEWVVKYFKSNTEVLIFEVDGYYAGEISRSCSIAPADYAILLNIGDQHLERFHSKENLGKALIEVITSSKLSSTVLINYQTKEQIDVIAKNNLALNRKIIVVDTKKKFPAVNKQTSYNLNFCIKIAEILDIPERFLRDFLNNIPSIPRRQEKKDLFGFEMIDNSYNISEHTAKVSLEEAKKVAITASKKLLVITAGIPELSKNNADGNKKLGKILSEIADYSIILKSDFYKEISDSIKDKNKYQITENLQEFLKNELSNFSKSEWVILLLPELNDLYY